jgi:hypothetical protein
MSLDTRLMSVTIVYCKNGQQWQKEIDLVKAGGLWWNNPNSGNQGQNHVPGKQQKLGQDCEMLMGGGGSACWWDNQTSQWICPDGLGG